jgi:hypothetical protein
MTTDRLIEELVRDLRPAVPLQPPWVRAGWWLLGAVAYLGMLTLVLTSRADIAANGTGWRFMAPQAAALVMAAAAALAAFATTVPGASRRVLLPVAAAALLWIASLLGDAAQEWSRPGGVTLAVPDEWLCVAMAVFGGLLPAAGLARMLRRGALLTPPLTAALAAVAVTALANIGACLSHPHPSSAVILVWHGATMVTLATLAAWGSRRALAWEERGAAQTR